MKSGCSASSGSGVHSGSAASIISSWKWSRPSVIGQSIPVARTTTIVSRLSSPPMCSSTCSLIGAVVPLRRAPSTVISAFASENSMRSRTASGEKPPKTTLCGAPILAQAIIATTTSGIIGR